MSQVQSSAAWKRNLVIVAVAGAALATTFVAGRRPARVAMAPVAASFDGETLVRGIYFRQGPAAALLPANRYTPAPDRSPATTELRSLQNRIVARLRAEDPALLDRFASELRSGDVVRVDRALGETAQRIAALSNDEGYAPGKAVARATTFIWLGIGYWIAYMPKDPDLTSSALNRAMLAEAIVHQLTPSAI
jgi:SdpC family antimicrobial peptide